MGHIRMSEEDPGWFSGKKVRVERLASSNALPEEEQAALSDICQPGDSILMEQKNYKTFQSAKSSLDASSEEQV